MESYIGILLLNNNQRHQDYFKKNIHFFFECYPSYEHFLMKCDSLCSCVLLPMGYPQHEKVIHIAESMHIPVYLYQFFHSVCTIYKLDKVSLASLTSFDDKHSLSIKCNHQQFHIHMYDIFYIESRKNYIYINTSYDRVRLRMRLSDFIKKLDSSCFLRCHQSYIINIKIIYSLKRYEAILQNGTSIPISKTYSKAVREYYKNLYLDE